jgi:hypothetical protein
MQNDLYKKGEKQKPKDGETLSSSFFFSWFSSTHFFCSIYSFLLKMLMLLFKMACFCTCQISKQSCSPSLGGILCWGFFLFLRVFAIGLFEFQLTPISCMRLLLLGLVIHYCCGVTSWAQLMVIAMDMILLSCGSSSNVAVNGQMFIPDNASMLLVTIVV